MSFLLRSVILAVSIAAASGTAFAKAPLTCIKAGGVGSGPTEGWASFMAEAAMKNQVKAWSNETGKIDKMTQTCESGLVTTCTVRARACK